MYNCLDKAWWNLSEYNIYRLLLKKKVFKLDKNHSSSITSRRTPPKSNFKLTLMLMALPISYLVTTFPIFLIVIHGCILHLRNKDNNNWSGFINHTDDFQLAYALAKIAMYINNSINILFYILLGKNLRKDFLALLPFKRFHFEYKPASLAAEQCHSFSGSVYYDSTTAQHFYRQQNPQHRRISTQINSSRQLPIYKKTKEANFSWCSSSGVCLYIYIVQIINSILMWPLFLIVSIFFFNLFII